MLAYTRDMRRSIAIALVTMSIAAAASAQTVTLSPGLYEAESPDLLSEYTGSWVQVVDGDYSVMESATIDDAVSFTVSGTQLVVYRELFAAGGGTAEICIDSVCGTFTNISSVDQKAIPVAFAVDDGSVVTITNEDGGLIRLDSFLLLSNIEATPEVLPAPDPAREYVMMADGEIAAVDRVISGGDVVLIGIGAAQVALLLSLLVVSAWKK